MNRVLMSSKKQDWQTPPEFLALVRQVGPIALDPCTTELNPCDAKEFCYPAFFDGLAEDWKARAGGGLVYVNPPYSTALGPWASKIADEGMRGCEIIALTPARTDTQWFRKLTCADQLCFWKGRIKFVGAKDPAPFPSLVTYFGPRPDRFREVFSPYGWCPL